MIRSVNVDQSFMGLVWKPDMYIWDLNGGTLVMRSILSVCLTVYLYK